MRPSPLKLCLLCRAEGQMAQSHQALLMRQGPALLVLAGGMRGHAPVTLLRSTLTRHPTLALLRDPS